MYILIIVQILATDGVLPGHFLGNRLDLRGLARQHVGGLFFAYQSVHALGVSVIPDVSMVIVLEQEPSASQILKP